MASRPPVGTGRSASGGEPSPCSIFSRLDDDFVRSSGMATIAPSLPSAAPVCNDASRCYSIVTREGQADAQSGAAGSPLPLCELEHRSKASRGALTRRQEQQGAPGSNHDIPRRSGAVGYRMTPPPRASCRLAAGGSVQAAAAFGKITSSATSSE